MRVNVKEKELKTGDILICSTNRLLGRLIKKVSKSKYSHTAQVIKAYGEILVVEAQRAGNHVMDYDSWRKRYNYNYVTARPDKKVVKDTTYFARKVLSKAAQRSYDFKALFWDFPIFLYTGIWKGPKTEDAALIEGKWNCSTYTAWAYGFKEWWLYSPQNIFEECKKSEHFKFL